MRSIKFRGKSIYGRHKWLYGSLLQLNDNTYIIPISLPTFNLRQFLFISPTLGQFTGLYDITTWEELTKSEKDIYMCYKEDWKGKPIYEGDILHFKTSLAKGFIEEDLGVYLKVVYGRHNPDCDSLSDYIGFWAENECGHRSSIEYHINSHNAKVVGNIHDNKNLMNK